MHPEPLGANDIANATVMQPPPLASWYTQGHTDGIGDRLLMFDNSGTPSLELLRFRPTLVMAPGFEQALRERVDRLKRFKHRTFPEVRAVEYLDGSGDLTLVSTFTPGRRLADMFRTPFAGLHAVFATWLIRELTPAVAALHEEGGAIAHGALTPERIVLTPEGQIVIVEHVLGSALNRLQWPPDQLWQNLGVIAAGSPGESAALDRRTDVIQLGLIGLSVVLGRRVTRSEYPADINGLLDEFVRMSAFRSPALVVPLRRWLEQALGGKLPVFESAIEAREALAELGAHTGEPVPELQRSAPVLRLGPRPLTDGRRFDGGPGEPASADDDRDAGMPGREPAVHNAETDMRNTSAAAPDEFRGSDPATPTEIDSSEILEFFEAEQPASPGERPNPASVEPTVAPPPDPVASLLEELRKPAVPLPQGRAAALDRARLSVPLVPTLAVIAILEAVVIGGLLLYRPKPAPPPSVPVALESLQNGDVVLVNGQQFGVTPIELTLDSSIRSIQIQSRAPVDAPVAAATAPPVQKPAPPTSTDTAIAQAAARQRSGGLRLTSPIEIQVLEGERVLGSSVDGPIVASAGRHTLDFVNNAYGFRSRQQVEIKAGQIIGLTVTPPPGRVSINVLPWAQVWIDGNPVGETPLANLPLPVGEHQAIFRHPQLGERTERFVVRAGALTRVSATLGK